jgi:hypothetical protein
MAWEMIQPVENSTVPPWQPEIQESEIRSKVNLKRFTFNFQQFHPGS